MRTVTIDEAKIHLEDLVQAAASGEDVFIIKNDNFSVQLVPCIAKQRTRHFGSAKGLISMAPEFDEPLEDFNEHLK